MKRKFEWVTLITYAVLLIVCFGIRREFTFENILLAICGAIIRVLSLLASFDKVNESNGRWYYRVYTFSLVLGAAAVVIFLIRLFS